MGRLRRMLQFVLSFVRLKAEVVVRFFLVKRTVDLPYSPLNKFQNCFEYFIKYEGSDKIFLPDLFHILCNLFINYQVVNKNCFPRFLHRFINILFIYIKRKKSTFLSAGHVIWPHVVCLEMCMLSDSAKPVRQRIFLPGRTLFLSIAGHFYGM